jgi:proline iminopeptidase
VFPPISPYAHGLLPTTDGNAIYWETSGNPRGIPAVRLHGGPGSGLGDGYRRDFDPHRFLIVGIHQRGCGKSTPLASDDLANLHSNTTQAIIADLESVREHLGIERWLVTGVSWGTTLALAYTQAHPHRVTGIVLAAVTTTTATEVEWITEAMGRVFPREWESFAAEAHARPGQRLIDAYYERMLDPSTREAAALAWCRWEDVHVSLAPDAAPSPRYEDPAFRLLFATLVIHYWKHSAFLEEGALLKGMSSIGHIPGVLISGRLDVSSPLRTAWELHRAWPASVFVPIEHEGHSGASMGQELQKAIANHETPPQHAPH